MVPDYPEAQVPGEVGKHTWLTFGQQKQNKNEAKLGQPETHLLCLDRTYMPSIPYTTHLITSTDLATHTE